MDTSTQTLILAAVIGYFLGSIPFGLLLVRLFLGTDVRQSGSGNIGATNVARTSPKLGLATLLLDALKGLAAVFIASQLGDADPTTSTALLPMCVAALAAVIGHSFPVWLKFRGGKSVATALGSFVLIAPWAVLALALLFFVIVLLTRYVSLGSIMGAVMFPVLAWRLDHRGFPALWLLAAASLLVVVRHHANIGRLLAGNESRFALGKGKAAGGSTK